VPNSITMGGGEPRCKIITGPNMGGWFPFRFSLIYFLTAKAGRVLVSVWSHLSSSCRKSVATFLLLLSEWVLLILYWREWEVSHSASIVDSSLTSHSFGWPCSRTIYLYGRNVRNERDSAYGNKQKSRDSGRAW
jgi:hypothetical protein